MSFYEMVHYVTHITTIALVLSSAIFAQSHAQTATEVSEEAIASFEVTSGQNRIELIADFIRNADLNNVDHKPLVPYLEEAYRWEKDHPDPGLLNTLHLGKVNVLIADHKSPPEVIYYLLEILHSGEPLTSKDSISTYNFLYGIYQASNAYPEAWEALRMRDQVMANISKDHPNYSDYQKALFGGKSLMYYQTKQYEKAAVEFLKNIQDAHSDNDYHSLAGQYNNLGLCYIKMSKPDSAIFSLNVAAKYWDDYLSERHTITPGDSAFIDVIRGNIASALNQKGQYLEAVPLLLREIETDRKQQLFSYEVNALNELSISYIGLKQYEDASKTLDLAKAVLDDHPFPSGIRGYHDQRIKLYEATGKSNEALLLYKQLTAFNDSMQSVENNAQAAVMQVVYSVDEKNRELGKEKIRTAEAEAEAARQKGQKQILYFGVATLVVILIIFILAFVQRRKRAKKLVEQNQQIEHQKEIIEQSLIEKETLLKEVHHRVKNNLQLVSGILELQAVKFDDKNVREMMEEGQSRVRSMALIHQQLYQNEDIGNIDFKQYLAKLVNDIAITFNDKSKRIEIHINVNQSKLDINTAVPLGLIVNELITNSFKHAFHNRENGNIYIDLEEVESEWFKLVVRDDGNGLAENFDPIKSNSLGLRLVKGLTRQLGGEFSHSNGTGAQFIIQFKNGTFN